MKKRLFGAALLCALAACSAPQAADKPPAVTDESPAVTAPDAFGRHHGLRDV